MNKIISTLVLINFLFTVSSKVYGIEVINQRGSKLIKSCYKYNNSNNSSDDFVSLSSTKSYIKNKLKKEHPYLLDDRLLDVYINNLHMYYKYVVEDNVHYDDSIPHPSLKDNDVNEIIYNELVSSMLKHGASSHTKSLSLRSGTTNNNTKILDGGFENLDFSNNGWTFNHYTTTTRKINGVYVNNMALNGSITNSPGLGSSVRFGNRVAAYHSNSNDFIISSLNPIFNGNHSMRLGSNINGFKDGNSAESISRKLKVTCENRFLTFRIAQVANFLSHPLVITDAGFFVRVNGIRVLCYHDNTSHLTVRTNIISVSDYTYRNWTEVSVDLSDYVGTTIDLEFINLGCAFSHDIYSYIDDIKTSTGDINYCKGKKEKLIHIRTNHDFKSQSFRSSTTERSVWGPSWKDYYVNCSDTLELECDSFIYVNFNDSCNDTYRTRTILVKRKLYDPSGRLVYQDNNSISSFLPIKDEKGIWKVVAYYYYGSDTNFTCDSCEVFINMNACKRSYKCCNGYKDQFVFFEFKRYPQLFYDTYEKPPIGIVVRDIRRGIKCNDTFDIRCDSFIKVKFNYNCDSLCNTNAHVRRKLYAPNGEMVYSDFNSQENDLPVDSNGIWRLVAYYYCTDDTSRLGCDSCEVFLNRDCCGIKIEPSHRLYYICDSSEGIVLKPEFKFYQDKLDYPEYSVNPRISYFEWYNEKFQFISYHDTAFINKPGLYKFLVFGRCSWGFDIRVIDCSSNDLNIVRDNIFDWNSHSDLIAIPKNESYIWYKGKYPNSKIIYEGNPLPLSHCKNAGWYEVGMVKCKHCPNYSKTRIYFDPKTIKYKK